jgi:5'-nucleotidase
MPTDLSDTLVVGIAATTLFDLREADAFFRAQMAAEPATALQAYRQHMLEREQDPLADGTAMPLVRALLGLNRFQREGDQRALVEVVVLSRNSPETGLRVLHAIRERQLPILRHAFTGGESVVDYLPAFDVDLFLTTNAGDAQRVIDAGQCAAALLKPPPQAGLAPPEDQVRIAFDGDAVLFDQASERNLLPRWCAQDPHPAGFPASHFLRRPGGPPGASGGHGAGRAGALPVGFAAAAMTIRVFPTGEASSMP